MMQKTFKYPKIFMLLIHTRNIFVRMSMYKNICHTLPYTPFHTFTTYYMLTSNWQPHHVENALLFYLQYACLIWGQISFLINSYRQAINNIQISCTATLLYALHTLNQPRVWHLMLQHSMGAGVCVEVNIECVLNCIAAKRHRQQQQHPATARADKNCISFRFCFYTKQLASFQTL